jgi:hypothetical protein
MSLLILSATRACPLQSTEFASSSLTKQSCKVTMSLNKLESLALRLNVLLLLSFVRGVASLVLPTYPVDNDFLCLVCRELLLRDVLDTISRICGGVNVAAISESSIGTTELPALTILIRGGDCERRLVPLAAVDVATALLASNTGLLIIDEFNPDSP